MMFSIIACVPGAPDHAADGSTDTFGTDTPLPDGSGNECAIASPPELCTIPCWTFGVRACHQDTDGVLRRSPCTPGEMYGAMNTCTDAAVPDVQPADAGAPTDTGMMPDTGSGGDQIPGTPCPVIDEVLTCIGNALCSPIVQWCDRTTHRWTSCLILPTPDICRPDAGTPDSGPIDSGTPDIGTDTGSADTGTPDAGTDSGVLDIGSSDTSPAMDAGSCTEGMSRGCLTRCGSIGLAFCVGGSFTPCVPFVAEMCDAGMDASDVVMADVITDSVADATEVANTDVMGAADVVIPDATDASDVSDVADGAVDTGLGLCPCTGSGCIGILLCTTRCGFLGFTTVGEACVGGPCHPISPSSETCGMTDAGTDAGTDTSDATDSVADSVVEASTDAADALVSDASDASTTDATDAVAEATADATPTDVTTTLPDVPGDVDFVSISYRAEDPATFDPTCNGSTLAVFPPACVLSGVSCWHICHVGAAFVTSSDPTRSTNNSANPNAFIRPTAMRFIQTEDPLTLVDIAIVSAPMGRGVWQASAFVGIHAGFSPMFNVEDVLPRPAFGPDSFIWAVGQNALGQGLARNGSTTLYLVNADRTQALVGSWEIVASNPVNLGMPNAFVSGGNVHPLPYLCPAYLEARSMGSYRCNQSVMDEPVFSGMPILN